MSDLVSLEARARSARKAARAARARSQSRRAMGRLFAKYVTVVPSVFSARGELVAFRLLAPRAAVLERVRENAVLTLDSATEALCGLRFGRARNDYAYFASLDDLAPIEAERLGARRPGTRFPFAWTPPGREMLFAVVPRAMPPGTRVDGTRVVTREFLVRDLIGFYGLRPDLAALLERIEKGSP